MPDDSDNNSDSDEQKWHEQLERASLQFGAKQLRSKFKHAADFDVTGVYNKVNANEFMNALKAHVNSPTVQLIGGAYRGVDVIHYFDPATGRNVIFTLDGEFVSGWKLNLDQIKNLTTQGRLGGG